MRCASFENRGSKGKGEMSETRKSLRERLVRRLFQSYFRLTRPLTLGVRAVVMDGKGRIFLIRHTYVPGWQLPGGGVEKGQTVQDALKAELLQEGGLVPEEEPQLFAIYSNHHAFPNDHVLLYVVRRFSQPVLPRPNHEIAESGFFAPDALPEGTTPATRSRIREVLQGRQESEFWRE